VGTAAGGTDCGLIEVFNAPQSSVTSGDYEVFDDILETQPLCASSCISAGSTSVSCTAETLGLGAGRRLSDVSRLVVSFTARGSGYDTMNFEVASPTAAHFLLHFQAAANGVAAVEAGAGAATAGPAGSPRSALAEVLDGHVLEGSCNIELELQEGSVRLKHFCS